MGRSQFEGKIRRAFTQLLGQCTASPSPCKSLWKKACLGLALLLRGFMQGSRPKAAQTLQEDTRKSLLIPQNGGLVALKGRRDASVYFLCEGSICFQGKSPASFSRLGVPSSILRLRVITFPLSVQLPENIFALDVSLGHEESLRNTLHRGVSKPR